SGSQWIAGMERHVRHRAALRAAVGPVSPLGIGIALAVAVLARVGVDDAADGAVLGGELGLDAAPGATIAGEDDLAADVDAAPGQLVVVGGDALIDEDQLAGDVAVDRIGVVGGERLAGLRRGGVLREGRLAERRCEAGGLQELQDAGLRRREEDLELLDGDVVSPGAEQAGHEFGVLLAPRRADRMGMRREPLHPGAQVLGAEDGVEAGFQVALRGGAVVGKAQEWLRRAGRGRSRGAAQEEDREDRQEETERTEHGGALYPRQIRYRWHPNGGTGGNPDSSLADRPFHARAGEPALGDRPVLFPAGRFRPGGAAPVRGAAVRGAGTLPGPVGGRR